MSRATRLTFDNASYHIMVRGNQRQVTFIEKDDFLKYLELLKHYKRRYNFRLYGYCLMPNHVHLIVEVKKALILSKLMQGLNQTYTIWFNKKYKKVGHLWQGRYKSKVIEKNQYLLGCLEYVELNPIRANISKSPFDYPWSSWLGRLNHKKDGLLDTPGLT
ncbi:MAG: transposase [Candidatus Omnitrophota bacterium]